MPNKRQKCPKKYKKRSAALQEIGEILSAESCQERVVYFPFCPLFRIAWLNTYYFQTLTIKTRRRIKWRSMMVLRLCGCLVSKNTSHASQASLFRVSNDEWHDLSNPGWVMSCESPDKWARLDLSASLCYNTLLCFLASVWPHVLQASSRWHCLPVNRRESSVN